MKISTKIPFLTMALLCASALPASAEAADKTANEATNAAITAASESRAEPVAGL